ncbi:calcium-binding protein [Bradyrhizobium sp. ORS 285]|uniref:calcium-binding protein n=1 Tax=Bradyrhizobium sp. ORS 285 TaxID=115808 RepID=UPI001112A97A|nr:calcium-binding protein [Bradyrhizobium sp. ORS 285]
MSAPEYYIAKPVTPVDLDPYVADQIDAFVGDFLAKRVQSGTLRFFFKNFGPVGAALEVNKVITRDGDYAFIDGERYVFESLTKAKIASIVTDLIIAANPEARVAYIIGTVVGTGVSTIVWSNFIQPAMASAEEYLGTVKTRIELFDGSGTASTGVIYRGGLGGVSELDAIQSLVMTGLDRALVKPAIGSFINVRINDKDDSSQPNEGLVRTYDLLDPKILSKIAGKLGVAEADVRDWPWAEDAKGGKSTNAEILLPYFDKFFILQSGAKIALKIPGGAVDDQVSSRISLPKSAIIVDGDMTRIDQSAAVVAAFGTGGSGSLDLRNFKQVYAVGGPGEDVIRSGGGDDVLWGDVAGVDAEGSIDHIYGGDGADRIYGGGGADFLFGEGGKDFIKGGAGDDEIDGGDDSDTIWGGVGADVVHGGAGDDVVYAGSDVPGENDTSNNRLFGEAGKDVLYGSWGDDVLLGGADDDYLDGDRGVDTASYADATEKQKLVISSGGSAPDGFSATGTGVFLTVQRGKEVDVLHSVEKLMLSDQADELVVTSGTDLKSIKEINAGTAPDGSQDVFDASGYGARLEFVKGHLIGNGIDIVLDNFDVVKLPKAWFGVDTFKDVVTTGSIKSLYTSDGKDDVSVSGEGVSVDMGAGNDTLSSSGPGTIVKTGKGEDKVEISHNGELLVEDADESDRLMFYKNILSGAVRWGGSEDQFAYDIYGNKYGRSKTGDLIIIDSDGNKTFIPHFNFSVTSGTQIAGLYVVEITFKTVRSNMWTSGFETAAAELTALDKAGQALYGRKPNGRKDPLVLDLDGNGISFTIQEASRARFDIDKDGFAEPVGWIGGDDGFLVRDLNGNGVVDDVGELFGNENESGFAQLAQLDGNHDGVVSALDDGLADFNGDGVIDAADTFASIKVWVDANEDGITNAGELKSLADLNIVAIGTGSTPSTYTDGADTISATGTFTRADGSTGLAADVQLETDNYNTTWLGDSSVSEAASSRPNLKGFGTLTDLRVAMTLKPSLTNVVDTVLPSMATLSLSALREAVRPILYAWQAAVPVPTGTPGTEPTAEFQFVGTTNEKGAVLYDFIISKSDDHGLYYAYASGQSVRDANGVVIERPTLQQVVGSTPERGSWQTLTAADIAFLERFTGEQIGLGIPTNPSADAISRAADAVTAGWNVLNRLAIRVAMQGELKPFFAGITYDVATDTFKPTTDQQFAPMLEQIFQHTPSDPTAAGSYLEQWKGIIGMMLPDFQRDDQGRQITDAYLFANIVNAYENDPVNLSLQAVADKLFDIPASELVIGNGNLTGGDDTSDIFYLNSSDQVVRGQGGRDAYVVGYNFGHDVIQDVWQGLGDSQEDAIWFAHLNVSDLTFERDGLDLLITQNGTDNQIRVVDEFAGRRPGLVTAYQDFDKSIEVIKFADGTTWSKLDLAKAVGMPSYVTDDSLLGTPDADVLNGGLGTDYMSGGDGGDTYIFGRGDGHDTIEDNQAWIWGERPDFLRFGQGITLDDLSFHRDGNSNDVTISINGTDDAVTVKGQFRVDYGLLNTTIDRIEYFTFADGSYVSWEEVIQSMDASAGTAGNDVIYGFSYADTLQGGKGDDVIDGGRENDTYVYVRGDGNDTIIDGPDAQTSAFDTLVLKSINPSDVALVRDGNDVRLVFAESAPGAGDAGSVLLRAELDDWFAQGIEQVKFDDGTVWTQNDLRLKLLAQASTDGNDIIVGYNTNDVITGGKGDDMLAGGAGDDTYVYNRGDGNDVITEVTAGNYSTIDTLRLKGISPASVSFSRNGNDLRLVINESVPGANDGGSILLKDELGDWFSQGVETIVFDDGTTWDQTYLRTTALSQAFTPGDDVINGFNTNDILIGGRGNDTLNGGAGDDTYIYARGDGNDTIIDGPAGNFSTFDTLRLQGIDPAAISFVRNGNDLTLVIAESAAGAGDGGSILIKQTLDNWFSQGIEQVVFDNGTVWTQNDLRLKVLAQYSTTGNDVIDGFNTNDVITGGRGDDVMSGGSGDDTYVYSRGDGNDTIIEGTVGNASSYDTVKLQGIAAADVRLARNGNDLTLLIAESAVGSGDGGSILIKQTLEDWFSQGIERVQLDDGTVWTQNDLRLRWIAQNETAGADTITGFNGADVLDGGAGNDLLQGGGGSDTYVFGRGYGADTISDSGDGADRVLFKPDVAPADLRLETDGTNIVVRLAGSDDTLTILNWFNSNSEISTFEFADGTVWQTTEILNRAYGGNGTNAISAGNDTFVGTRSADVIDGLAGDDVLIGRGGGDTYRIYAGGGNDTILESEDGWATDVVQLVGLNSGDVTLSRVNADLLIRINATGETTTVSSHFVSTDRGIEQIAFADGTTWNRAQIQTAAWFTGTTGAETIAGTDGADVIQGNGGDDLLLGAGGSDTYRYASGDGSDVIRDVGSASDTDVLLLTDLNRNQVTLSRSVADQNDLLITVNATGAVITVDDHFLGAGSGIEKLQFADGTSLDRAGIANAVPIVIPGTSGADTLNGDNNPNMLLGLDGNDSLYGRDGNDILVGGAGNDYLEGGNGNDTYQFNLGDGQDTILDNGWTSDVDLLNFGSGIRPADIVVAQVNNGSDLLLSIAGTSDSILLRNQLNGWGTWSGVDEVHFADGTVWNRQAMVVQSTLANAGNDTFYGDLNANILSGGAGNDSLYGRDGNDVLAGGTGNDYLEGGNGNDVYLFNLGDGQDTILDNGGSGELDVLNFGAGINVGNVVVSQANNGSDILLSISGTTDAVFLRSQLNGWAAWSGADEVHFADGTVWNRATLLQLSMAANSGNDIFYGDFNANSLFGGAGNDNLYGRDGNDILAGGTGNDYLEGGNGNDTYQFNLGDGQDTILDNGGSGELDILNFGAGISAGNVVVSQANNGSDILLSISGTTDAVYLRNQLNGWAAWSGADEVHFTDGTVWDRAKIWQLSISANSGNDSFYGDFNANSLFGGAGDDNLYGRDGNDVLAGGTGNDYLEGGAGNDTYVFNRGDGQDTILDNGGSGDSDVLNLGADISVNDIIVSEANNGSDLLLSIAGSTDSILLKSQLNGWAAWSGVDSVHFADGTIWNRSTLVTRSMLANGGDDTFYGDFDANSLFGGTGNDSLYGRDGNDTLNGGPGNDYLNGGNGADTYVYSSADGNDVIEDNTSDNVLVMQDIASTSVILSRPGNGADLVIENASTGKTILVKGQFGSGSLATVSFSDGVSWSAPTISGIVASQPAFIGTDAADTFTGTANAETIDGRGGSDTLNGGAGADTYLYRAGSGNDVIQEAATNSGTDVVRLVGLSPSDVDITRNGTDLLIRILSSGETLTVKDQFLGSGTVVELLQFGPSGTVIDLRNNAAPTVTISSAAETSNVAVQTITGTVTAGGIGKVVGQTVTLTDNGVTLGTATVQADGSFSATVTLPNQGSNAIVASVTDSLGNTGASSAVVDFLYSTPPTVAITGVSHSGYGATQTISGTVTAAGAAVVAGRTVTLTDNGVTLGTATVQANGSFSLGVALPKLGGNALVATVVDNYGNTGRSAAVVDSYAGVLPTIRGTVAGQTTTSEAAVHPFSTVTIDDLNVGATDTLTITLNGGGGTLSGTGLSGANGVYTLSGSAASITAQLRALTFTPTAGVPNSSPTTTFTLSDSSSGYVAPSYSSPGVLYAFNSNNGTPIGGLTLDAAGNLFGTTVTSGQIFELAKSGSGWSSTPSYLASVGTAGNLFMDAAGNLFGATAAKANSGGTVYELVKNGSGWNPSVTTVATFTPATTGSSPSSPIMDAAGNLLGTTQLGGVGGRGTVYEIVKTGTTYSSTPIVLASFNNENGQMPFGQLILDSDGNLLGATATTVFEIPKTASGYGSMIVLGSGIYCAGGLTLDPDGNLFGVQTTGGAYNSGGVYELQKTSSGYSAPTLIASFTSNFSSYAGPLVIDGAGNLYGTAATSSTFGRGNVFKVVKTGAGYNSTVISMTNFNGVNGLFPGQLTMDAAGNLLGEAQTGGANNAGVIFKVTNLSSVPVDSAAVDSTTTVIDVDPPAVSAITLATASDASMIGVGPAVVSNDAFTALEQAVATTTTFDADRQLSQLVQAMASYGADGQGFDVASAALASLNDVTLQNALAVAS